MACALVLVLVPTSAVGCGCCCDDDDDESPEPPLTIASIQPNPLVSYLATPFTLTGSGFARSGGAVPSVRPRSRTVAGTVTDVVVTFVATEGTPFSNGTSASAQVPGTVISDTEVQGVSPVTNVPGGFASVVRVTDALGSADSPAAIAFFVGLTVFDADPEEIRADQATPFTVQGLEFLPVGGTATVRFTATVPGSFAGPSDTLDVTVDVVSLGTLSGVTPSFPLAAPTPAFVTVLLDQVAGAPAATSPAALVTFVPPPVVPVVVTTITSPMPIDVATPFTITGSGFLGSGGGPTVAVTFTSVSGTPWLGRTASSITVLGTATDDGTISGTSPIGYSTTDVQAFVTVTRADGVSGTSTPPIALFTAPPATATTFRPLVVPTDTATPFTITGANLPSGQAATVRFRATEGAPFAGATSAVVDVPATVTSASQIDGTSPLASASAGFPAEVTVLLPSGSVLEMGVSCFFVPPAEPGPGECVVTNLLDSGPGSLRDLILDAPLDCVITFDPSLSGDLVVVSTLSVPHTVHVLGPGPDVVRVTADGGVFPVFTIEAAASATVIAELGVGGSRAPGDGGGFVVEGGLTLTRCDLFDHDVGGRGGGVFVAAGGTATLEDCTVRDSSAGDRGGGLFVAGGATAAAVGCTFEGNSAAAGGGGLSLDSQAQLSATNCTIHGNDGGGPGGGGLLVQTGSTVTLVHCTVTANTTQNRGGGVMINGGTLGGRNCIFSRNADSKGDLEISNKNGTCDVTFSLLRVGTGSGLSDGALGNQVGTPSAPVEPHLGSLQANGGPTRTQALLQGSPAIDAGSAAFGTPTDQRGIARPSGAGFDLGAYELTPTL